jgi:hypothetical protein
VYTCHASLSAADFKLMVKPKPGGSSQSGEESREGQGSRGDTFFVPHEEEHPPNK